jgi:FKBP-type peptidyl-prolyl cis-trans isomerase FklB
MKKPLVFFLTVLAFTASAQVKKTTPAPKTATPVKVLKNLNDSASYAIGLSIVNFYKQQGINSFNTALITRAINDVTGNKTILLSNDQANACMIKLMNQSSEANAKENIEAGKKFLAQNKTRPGVKITPSGLQYEILRAGDGPKPTINDSVEVNYRGTLIDGTEFDNSYARGQSIIFDIKGVIRGWTEALQLMPAGSKYKIFIPYDLAYGLQEREGSPIKAGSALIFEVELIRVINNK